MQKKINIQNKRARFEYELIDQYTAGLVLTGTEIKSIRLGKATITDSFCEFNDRGELFVINMDIQEYAWGTHYNHRPKACPNYCQRRMDKFHPPTIRKIK